MASYLGYIVSFATVGAIWLSHNSITHYLHSASTTFLRLNLALLLVVSFLPFPTKLLAENLRSRDGERVAATIYGVTLLGAMLLIFPIKLPRSREATACSELNALTLPG
jgi:uncharacterized membrane protein